LHSDAEQITIPGIQHVVTHELQPLVILNTRWNELVESNMEVLVQWEGLSPDDTTWGIESSGIARTRVRGFRLLNYTQYIYI